MWATGVRGGKVGVANRDIISRYVETWEEIVAIAEMGPVDPLPVCSRHSCGMSYRSVGWYGERYECPECKREALEAY